MIIKIDDSDTDINTDRDLSPEERHIVQKLLGWKSLLNSVSEFRQKKESALLVGWNNSGPIRESRAVSLIARQFEKEILHRLQNENSQ